MYYYSVKSLVVIVDCSAQIFNWCSEGGKKGKKNKQERLFGKETVNNFPVYKVKMYQHSSTEYSFSDLKLKNNTMTYARTFGVQEAAYILQKKNKNYFFFLFLTMEAALPCSIKLNSKVTMIFVFYTWTPRETKAFKEAVKVGLFNSIYKSFEWF